METINLGKVAFAYKGDYNPATTYASKDVVFDGESSYISKSDGNVGNALSDATFWGYLAKGNAALSEQNAEEIDTLRADLNIKTEGLVQSADDGFYFCDKDGNTVAKINGQGIASHKFNTKKGIIDDDNSGSTYFVDIYGNVAMEVDKYGFIYGSFIGNKATKSLLAIGDSVTASPVAWHKWVGKEINKPIISHAYGGIGIIQMVDGYGGQLPALNYQDLVDVDTVCIMGCLNEIDTAVSNKGNITDMYPTNNTFIGKLRYAIKRIYDESVNANNREIKIVIISPHFYGKNGYRLLTAYDDGAIIFNAMKEVADYEGVMFCDVMHNSGINAYNWDLTMSNALSEAPSPNIGIPDHLHPNEYGHKLIGHCVSKYIKSTF